MKNHTDLLNYIARKINAASYLEIGVSNGKNFMQINVPTKVGVDPDQISAATIKMTSDEFFRNNKSTFDLIFIDGLHVAKQARKDVVSGWNVLTKKGVIVIHDVNPEHEAMTHVPRDTKIWCGDVYKTASAISGAKFTLDFDYGCCVLRKKDFDKLVISELWPSWYMFNMTRKSLLNLVSVEEGLKIIDSWT